MKFPIKNDLNELPKPTTRIIVQGLISGLVWGALVIYLFEISRWWLFLYAVAGFCGTYVSWCENKRYG